jgi:hypothetical protein
MVKRGVFVNPSVKEFSIRTSRSGAQRMKLTRPGQLLIMKDWKTKKLMHGDGRDPLDNSRSILRRCRSFKAAAFFRISQHAGKIKALQDPKT